MNDQKKIRNSLTIVQQSITEYLRFLKSKLELSLFKQDLKSANRVEALLSQVEDHPERYTIVHIQSGDEQKFRDILAEKNVSNFYVNASFMEQFNGSWIIPTAQYQELLTLKLFDDVPQEREVMLDEDIVLPEKDTIDHLRANIDHAISEAQDVGDDTNAQELKDIKDTIAKIDTPILVRSKKGQEKNVESVLQNDNCPYCHIQSLYLQKYTGAYIIPRSEYEQLLSLGLIETNEDLNHDERDLNTPDSSEEEDITSKGSEEDTPEVEDVSTEENSSTEKEGEKNKKKNTKEESKEDRSQSLDNTSLPEKPYEPYEESLNNEIINEPTRYDTISEETSIETKNYNNPVTEPDKPENTYILDDVKISNSTELEWQEKPSDTEINSAENTEQPYGQSSTSSDFSQESINDYQQEAASQNNLPSYNINNESNTPNFTKEISVGFNDINVHSNHSRNDYVDPLYKGHEILTDKRNLDTTDDFKNPKDFSEIDDKYPLSSAQTENDNKFSNQSVPSFEEKTIENNLYSQNSDTHTTQGNSNSWIHKDQNINTPGKNQDRGENPQSYVDTRELKKQINDIPDTINNPSISFKQDEQKNENNHQPTFSKENYSDPNIEKPDFATSRVSNPETTGHPDVYIKSQSEAKKIPTISEEQNKPDTKEPFLTYIKDKENPIKDNIPFPETKENLTYFENKSAAKSTVDEYNSPYFKSSEYNSKENNAHVPERTQTNVPRQKPNLNTSVVEHYQDNQAKAPETVENTVKNINNPTLKISNTQSTLTEKVSDFVSSKKDNKQDVYQKGNAGSTNNFFQKDSQSSNRDNSPIKQKNDSKPSSHITDSNLTKSIADANSKKTADQDNNAGDKRLVAASDKLTKAVFVGHHDVFERAAFKATFSELDDTDLTKSKKVLQHEGFVNALRAANGLAVTTLVEKDVSILLKQFDSTQLGILSKLISKNDCGNFDLSDPGKYESSMKALHKYMTRAGILEKRSVTNSGPMLYSVNENAKVYEGNIFDQKISSKKEREIKKVWKKEQKEAKKRNKAPEIKSGKRIDIAATTSAKEKRLKKAIVKNKDRSLGIIKKDLGRLGIKENEANDLLNILLKNSKKFSATSRIMTASEKGMEKIKSLNPFKNPLTAKAIKEDVNAQYIYRAQTLASGSKAMYHAGSVIAKAMHDRDAANLAQALNRIDTKLTKDGLSESAVSRLKKQRDKINHKKITRQTKYDNWSRRKKKVEAQLKKINDNLIKKPQEVFKRPARAVGRRAKSFASRIPGLNKIVNFKWSVYVQKHQFIGRLISLPFQTYSSITGFITTKILIPLLSIIGHILIFALGASLVGGLMITAFMMIDSLFTNEPFQNDAISSEEILNTTMGLVYNELQLEEATWTHNLAHSADDAEINVKDIKYTKIDEGSGNIDETYRNVDAATYIKDILGLEYDSSTDTIITPAPWVGAPADACHTADGKITGGVELRYVGIGGYPSYTSNIMEIIAMASVANDDSTLVEYDDNYLSEATNTSILNKIESFGSSIIKGIKFAANAMGKFFDSIIGAIPGGSDFLSRNQSKTRAKTYYAYTKPLFNFSHQTAYGLEFSFLPTDRTLGLAGANTINQFFSNLWSGEGFSGLDEATDSEIPRQVWTYLKQHGFDDIHAAGVMGNFYQESRFDVNCVQYPGQRKGGIGLGQWTGLSGGRRAKLESYALMMTGSSEGWRNNVKLQLDFMMTADEPQTVQSYLHTNLSSPEAAAYWWGHYWERFNENDGSMNKTRIPAALKYYELYAGKTIFGSNESESDESNTDENNQNGNSIKNITKYSHTSNIDDQGNATRNYANNIRYTDSVKIEGAKSLRIEIYYSTEQNCDWLNIRNAEQGPLGNWNSGNRMYHGKSSDTETGYKSKNHETLIIEGDTAYFSFYSDRSVTDYGYYAIVTAESVAADTSWLDDQIAATSQIPSILINANICTGHNGHGCQSYSHFGYNDTTKQYVEYNGKRIETVYPAALDPTVSNGEVACNAPSGTEGEFYNALDHNPDCWQSELIDTETDYGTGLDTRGMSSYFDSKTSYGYTVTSGSPHEFYVTDTIDEEYHSEGDSDYRTLTEQYWKFTHNCNQQHTGFYCGGHMRLIIYGLIYHMTPGERANNHESYTEKTSVGNYVHDVAASFFQTDEDMASKDLLNKANDLFDLDMAIKHVKGSTSAEFPGWTYDYVDAAAMKLEDDWNELYGIKASWTINGLNASGASIANVLSSAEIENIKRNLREQYPHNDTDMVRESAINTALAYVGKIGYNQAYHGSPLQEGGYNDCSGYVSRCYYEVLRQIYNTDGFKALAIKYHAYRNFTDGNCKPGDILLRGMETATRKDNHALLYLGVIDGENNSVDCSSSGGVGNVFYRARGDAYYNSCTYIDMDVFIKGYLLNHPEAAGNLTNTN